jgi:putative transposase
MAMKRTNTFEVRPLSESEKALLREVMDATASLWNELTYARQQQFFDEKNIWKTEEFRGQYKGPTRGRRRPDGAPEEQPAWKSLFALLENGGEEVLSTDPVRVALAHTVDDDDLTLTIDEDVSVVI